MARKEKQEEVLYNEKGERVVYRDAPKKKSKVLPGCLGLLLLMLLIGACAAAMGGGDNKKDTANDTSKENTTATKEETKKAHKIGDTVKVGKMEYKVNGVTTGTSVGPAALPENAKDTFVIVDIEVKNNGDEAITVDSSLFKLKTKGKTLEADSAASMSANQSEDGNIENSFFLEQLNPDSTTKGKVVYDVSKAMADSPDKQLEVATGFFGTETDLIDLK
ncbi:DUF4352 domain-containing protein [Macrococcoides canis]|uniref:DUF4352 domain-containing protein n=1 Tax=Macrococcoides canis TaxID=1855823 RepID=UPI00207C62E2|nr:DUF4352 domain-containing protein [Macrococcus canis]